MNYLKTLCQCFGKYGFDSYKVAIIAARHKKLSAYRCDTCGKWHVGNNEYKQKLIKSYKHQKEINYVNY